MSVFIHHGFGVPLLWAGVDLFFVLSGFLITGILLEAKAKPGYFADFYLKRAFRIIPPYYLTLLLTTIIGGVAWSALPWYLSFTNNIWEALNLHSPPLLIQMWSLAVEEQFYLLWPLVVLACTTKTLRKLAIGLLVTVPLLRGLATPFVHSHYVIYYSTPFRLDLLACGSYVASLWREAPDRVVRLGRAGLASSLLSLLALGGISRVVPQFRTGNNFWGFNVFGYSLMLVVVTGPFLYALSIREGAAYRFLTHPWLRRIGAVSYTAYLIHVIGLEAGNRLGDSLGLPHVAAVGIALGATLLYSGISFRFLESPLLRVRSRLVERLSAARAGTAAT